MVDILCKTCGHYQLRHSNEQCNAKGCSCKGYILGRLDDKRRLRDYGGKYLKEKLVKRRKKEVDSKPGNKKR